MVILLCFDFMGILFSFLFHLCLLLGFVLPNNIIAVVMNIGLFAVIGIRVFVTKELREKDDWFFAKSLKGIYPRWLKMVTVLIAIYGGVSGVVYFSGMVSKLSPTMIEADFVIAVKKLFLGYYSLMMICYAIEFLLLYSFRILKKAKLKELKSEGIVW